MAFKQLKQVNKAQKDAVYAWIRNKERILKLQYVPAMVTAICILYYREFDAFDQDLITQYINVDDEHRTISTKGRAYGGNAFGINIAMKGKKYHWRIKIEKDESNGDPSMGIGIFESDIAQKSPNTSWWVKKNGHSYYRSGAIFTNGVIKSGYCAKHKSGDIIDIWLDLKEDFALSFGKNKEKYEKSFDVDMDIKYRLAIYITTGKAKIESFQVNY